MNPAYLREALELARLGRGQTSPNPMVGAVLVREGQVVGRGFHTYSGLTLDGKIAAPDDNRGWITSEVARAHVQRLRHDTDAILTGIGTVLADDCLLNDRTGLARSRPLLRLVLDSQLRIPAHSKMLE